jgi:hypothetical protein
VYKQVIHIVRDPIKVIESRAYRLALTGVYKNIKHFMKRMVGAWENADDLVRGGSANTTQEDATRFALKHWVRRNSFVHQVASWVEQIEQLSKEPLVAWRMCMAAGFGHRCPPLEHWRIALSGTSKHTNTDHGKASEVERQKIDWSTLLQLEPM